MGPLLQVNACIRVCLLVLEGCRDRAECEDRWLFATAGGIVFGLGAAVMGWGLVRRMADRGKPR